MLPSDMIAAKAKQLTALAKHFKLNVEIINAPLQPLAMGNTEPVIKIWPKRGVVETPLLDLKMGHLYRFKGQRDMLGYLGKKGLWHQFRKVTDKRPVWCEVLDEDLSKMEEWT